MDSKAMVTSRTSVEPAEAVVKSLEAAGVPLKLAAWLDSPDHGEWKLVLASPLFDASPDPYHVMMESLRKAGHVYWRHPLIVIEPMSTPFVREARRSLKRARQVYGEPLFGQYGKEFVVDGVALRAS